jgi:signal transduction histidine kinase
MNKSFFAALPPTEHERVKSALAKAKQQKQPEQVETQVKRSDGTVIDIELSAEYSESDIVFYCVARDISERKEIESIKEQLMAMLSHDLKTPLSSLKFSLALLNSADYGKLTEDGENIRRIGENNVERLIQLINQLLDLHRLDANQLKLNLKDVSVSEIIKPALEAIENLAEQKSMDVTIDADEATVHADKDRMVQVIINLLSNAIKYSPAETNIRLEVKSLPGDWLVEFRVSDSGPGIAKEHKQAVFDRFFRVVSEDGKTPEGSGLGLAICKAIVEAHGGKIDVENNSPNGSSFFCHLPAAKDKTAA